jgi:hypothetical protein
MQAPAPQKEHEWLQQLAGEWTYDGECVMGPDQPPIKTSGRASNRMLGGVWLLSEGEGEAPGGGTAQMNITLGYDPAKKRIVGTFIGSMMCNLWIYDGDLDAAGKVLTLNAEGPSFAGDSKTAHYQDIIEIKDKDHHVLSSQMLGEDGKWTQFMTAHYRRKK